MSQRFCELRKELERVVDPFRCVGPAERVGRDAQVVVHGQVGQQPAALRNDSDAGAADPFGAHPGQIALAEQDAAAARPEHSADREHQGRLPGPVRAQQGGHLAGRDLHRDLAHDGMAAARDGEGVESQALAHSSSSVPR